MGCTCPLAGKKHQGTFPAGIAGAKQNTAEQASRFARVKEKVSECFRTEKGADHFARVLSFISTAVRHGISCFDACLSLRNGSALALVEEWVD